MTYVFTQSLFFSRCGFVSLQFPIFPVTNLSGFFNIQILIETPFHSSSRARVGDCDANEDNADANDSEHGLRLGKKGPIDSLNERDKHLFQKYANKGENNNSLHFFHYADILIRGK